MDLKQSKPIHIRCKKCGNDITINSNRVEEEYQNLKFKRAKIINRMVELKNQNNFNKKMPEWKRLLELKSNVDMQITAIKKVRSRLADEGEREAFILFKKIVAREVGKEKMMRWIKEAEDEMSYSYYDMAVQRHNNFNNI